MLPGPPVRFTLRLTITAAPVLSSNSDNDDDFILATIVNDDDDDSDNTAGSFFIFSLFLFFKGRLDNDINIASTVVAVSVTVSVVVDDDANAFDDESAIINIL